MEREKGDIKNFSDKGKVDIMDSEAALQRRS